MGEMLGGIRSVNRSFSGKPVLRNEIQRGLLFSFLLMLFKQIPNGFFEKIVLPLVGLRSKHFELSHKVHIECGIVHFSFSHGFWIHHAEKENNINRHAYPLDSGNWGMLRIQYGATTT